MKLTRLIEDYLDGTLRDEEKRELQERALRDKELQQLITLHKEVNESIRDKELSSFSLLTGKTYKAYVRDSGSSGADRETHIKPLWSHFFLRLAAVFLLTAGAGIALFYTLFRNDDPEKIYLAYYVSYDADMISRSAPGKLSDLDSAVMQYSLKDYTDALLRFNRMLSNNAANYQAWFYRGLACMETSQYNEALRSFTNIPVNWNSPYNEHREWYQALVLLQVGNEAKAATAFREISQKGGYYSKKAAKVRKKIKT